MFKYNMQVNMKRIVFIIISIVSVTLFFYSCKCNRTDSAIYEKEKIPEKSLIHIQRFEKDLFAINIDSVSDYVPMLRNKYNEFFDIYNYKIIRLGSSDNPKYATELKKFITDYYMNLNYKRVIETFPDVKDIELNLNQAFALYTKFFPEKSVPKVFTCISGWNESVFTADTILGIALDNYLGSDCDFYEKLGISQYIRYSMQKEYIIPDCMKAWCYMEFELNDSANNVFTNLLYEGKIIYLMKKLLPETEDTLIFGFRRDQLKWCENNLKQMWTYLAEHKLLFSSDFLAIRKLFYPAPFTSFYTNESPGRASVFLGYKIIDTYMKNNKDITLPNLMNDSDYQLILRKSKFNP